MDDPTPQIDCLLQRAYALITQPSVSDADRALAAEQRALATELRLFSRYVRENSEREDKRAAAAKATEEKGAHHDQH